MDLDEPKPNEPLDKTTATDELGLSGTLIFNGIITQEDYNANLAHIKGIRTYEIMRRSDSTVRQALNIVKLPIQSTTWDVQAYRDKDGKTSDKAQLVADFVKYQLFSQINFDQFIKEALNCFDFGFSLFEKVYQPVTWNGQTYIGLKKLASRKQLSIFRWETLNGEEGVTQMVMGKTISIPRNKLIVFTYDKEGDNYEGISLLRSIYKDWDIKDKLTLVNAMALEKQGMGVPTVSERDGQVSSPEDQLEAEKSLSQLRANEAAYLKVPNTMKVEFLDMKGNTTKEILPTLNYHDGRIMTGVLARFMEMGGASGTGAKALSADLSSIFMRAEETVAKQFASALYEDFIKQLCDLNFSNMDAIGYPKLTFGTIGDDDVVLVAQALFQLGQAGLIHADADLEDNLRQRFRLPELSQEMKDNYEEMTNPAPLPPAQTAEVVKAAQQKFFETKDPNQAIQAAREFRNALVDELNGV